LQNGDGYSGERSCRSTHCTAVRLQGPHHRFTDPASVEALAAGKAAELCHRLGLEKVILEGDAMEVVAAFRCDGGGLGHFGFGQVVFEAQQQLEFCMHGKAQHIPRTANEVAHGLAKLALASEEEHLWTSDFWSYDFLSNI
jgi:hypothetical protein